MIKNNKKCITCGNEYYYCSSCNTKDPMWKNLWDTENCKNIFETVSDYAQKSMSEETAKEKLMACDLSNKDSFKESIQKYLNEIFKDDMAATQEKTQKPVHKTQDTSKAKYVPRKQRNIEKQIS